MKKENNDFEHESRQQHSFSNLLIPFPLNLNLKYMIGLFTSPSYPIEPMEPTQTDCRWLKPIPSSVGHEFLLLETDFDGSNGGCPPLKPEPSDPIGKPLQKTLKSTIFYPNMATIRPSPLRSGHVWPFSTQIHLNPAMFGIDLLKSNDVGLRSNHIWHGSSKVWLNSGRIFLSFTQICRRSLSTHCRSFIGFD